MALLVFFHCDIAFFSDNADSALRVVPYSWETLPTLVQDLLYFSQHSGVAGEWDLRPTQPLCQYEYEKRETCHWSRTFYLCDIANTTYIEWREGPGTYSAVSFRQGNLPFSWGNGQSV